jgi:hypothetical protein
MMIVQNNSTTCRNTKTNDATLPEMETITNDVGHERSSQTCSLETQSLLQLHYQPPQQSSQEETT